MPPTSVLSSRSAAPAGVTPTTVSSATPGEGVLSSNGATPLVPAGCPAAASIRFPIEDLALFDPQSNHFLAHPFHWYDSLRSQDPVHWHQRTLRWYVTSYSDVYSVLGDTARFAQFKPASSRSRGECLTSTFRRGLHNMDGAQHAQTRAAFQQFFTATFAQLLGPTVEAEIDELIKPLERARSCEFMTAFANRLPLNVMCRLLGLPKEDYPRLKELSDRIASGANNLSCSARGFLDAKEATDEFVVYLEHALKGSTTSVLSAMLGNLETKAPASRRAHLQTIAYLFTAGHESTAAAIGSMVHALSTNREQFALLESTPSLATKAVQEVLRLEAPIQVTLRVATQDTQLSGREIKEGQLLAVLIGAANRDPEHYVDPHKLDITRASVGGPDLTFGRGVHHCIGMPLAQMELQRSLSALLQRCPRIFKPTSMVIEQNPNLTVHGPRSLFLRY